MKGAKGSINFYDFKPYAPSNNLPAAFISTPIYDGENVVGVFAFQMPIERINTIMSQTSGMGKTGETIIAGADGYMRNNSRFTKEDDILVTKFNTTIVSHIFKGEKNFHRFSGYRSIVANGVGSSLSFHGAQWAVIALQDDVEVTEPLHNMQMSMMIASLSILGLIAAIGYSLALSLTNPMNGAINSLALLAKGDTNFKTQGLDRVDEIGDINRSISVFQKNAIERDELAKQVDNERQREYMRQIELEKRIHEFKGQISVVLHSADKGTYVMRETADKLTDVSTDANNRAEAAQVAAQSSSGNVQAVAAAGEELSASIREIATQAQKTSNIVQRATEIAQ
jgi:methyl-accepting chemotaxis protein